MNYLGILGALVIGAGAGLLNRGVTKFAIRKGLDFSGFWKLYLAHMAVMALCLAVIYFAAVLLELKPLGYMAAAVVAQLTVIVIFTRRDHPGRGR